MSEMVERVARAIALAQLDNDTRAVVDPNTWPVAESYCDMARAAIEAMREPTKVMIYVGNNEIEDCHDSWSYDSGSGCLIEPEAARNAWQSMIDAALSEKS
jgi:hypothetical protein